MNHNKSFLKFLLVASALFFSGKQVNAQTYCSLSGPFNSCIYNGATTRVQFAGLDNSSTCTGSDYSYADYTSTISPVTIASNNSYSISVDIDNPNNGGVGVWIDFDRDGLFEASEFTSLGTS